MRMAAVSRLHQNSPGEAFTGALLGIFLGVLAFVAADVVIDTLMVVINCRHSYGFHGPDPICVPQPRQSVLYALGAVALGAGSLVLRQGAKVPFLAPLVAILAVVRPGQVLLSAGDAPGTMTVAEAIRRGPLSLIPDTTGTLGTVQLAVTAIAAAGVLMWLWHWFRSYAGSWVSTLFMLILGIAAGTAGAFALFGVLQPHYSGTMFVRFFAG